MQRFAAAVSALTASMAASMTAGAALAQDNAVRAAADAFGERAGIEQLGLYSEGQVRGFDLQNSGAYRIDDAYFVRASPLNDPVLAGVSVRVGVNAARLPYPAPSGVVNYRLRTPSERNQLSLGFGIRDYETPTFEANGSWRADDDRLSLAGGLVVRPTVRWPAGSEGEAVDLGLVGRFRLGENQRLTAFATVYERGYDGDYGLKVVGTALPPNVQPLRQYAARGSRVEATSFNTGLLYNLALGGWTVDASAFRSIWDARESDFTLLKIDGAGNVSASAMLAPRKTNISDSGELRLSRVFAGGDVDHLVSASLRMRRSTVDLTSTHAVALPDFTLAGPTPVKPDVAWRGTRGEDRVDQTTASLGYGLSWNDRLQLRLGVHRTRYEKTVESVAGPVTRGQDETTLYNASVIWSPTPRTSLFASWVTGLEETGSAPQSATNAFEVLAPVEAEQRELGVRQSLGDLTLIAALFEVSKPTTGFRADGSFGLVGEVAHRGVEASLAGPLGEKTSIVLGGVAFEAEVSGELVDAGVVGAEAAGISTVVLNGNVERQLVAGWSVDAQVTYNNERWVDSANTLRAPAQTTLNIGARRRFELGGRPAQFRVLASNVTGEAGYWGSPNGLIWPIAPRTIRASLTITFGG